MRIVTLIENEAPQGLLSEWGLSLWIEHRGRRYLLDAGASDAFARNAVRLGVDLARADAAVLSHAHYDHADGMGAFCTANRRAPVYVRRAADENCYSWHGEQPRYIGVRPGLLELMGGRLARVDGVLRLAEDVALVPHARPDMAERGRRAQMFVRRGERLCADDFAHEQSMVFALPEGLVAISSCTHGGVDALLEEASLAFPSRPVRALVGGLHLFRTPPDEGHALAERLAGMDGLELYVGHCTGEAAQALLAERMPGRVHRLCSGTAFEIGGEGRCAGT